MSILAVLLFLIINIYYIFLGAEYFTIFLRHNRRWRITFVTVWFILWIILNLLCDYVIIGSHQIKWMSVAALCVMFLAGSIKYYQYDQQQRRLEENDRLAAHKKQLDYYAREYKNISEKQIETRKMRHEIKNNYILLKALAEKKDIDGIVDCIGQFMKEHEQEVYSKTGNMVVDAVINYKIAQTKQENIKYHLHFNIPTEFATNDVKFCGLLANALDNAIEACLKLPQNKRNIWIDMEVQKRNLFLEIRNSYDGQLRTDENGRLLTRKEEKLNHGFGLSIMEDLLSNNFGTMETYWDHEIFGLRMILYFVI